MKFSTKLLLLILTLAAELLAYVQYRHVYVHSQRVNQGNAKSLDGYVGIGFTATDESAIVELDSRRSLFYFGPNRNLVAATIAGPAGHAYLSVLAKDLDAIDNLTLASNEAIDTFKPNELPAIKRLILRDLDWATTDLASFGYIKHLEKLYLDARTNDPKQVLATIPADASLDRIELVAYRQFDVAGMNVPIELKTLTISCPELDADAIKELQSRIPACSVIGYDNAELKVVPSG